MRKRIKELVIGDVFWFSGVWRQVSHIDEKFLYYNRAFKKDNEQTVMANSMMIVEVNNNIDPDTFKHYGNGKPIR